MRNPHFLLRRFRLVAPVFLWAIVLVAIPCFAQEPLPNAAAIRSYYEAGLRKNGIVGSSLALVREGKVVFHDDYGLQGKSPDVPVDDSTAYHWASCTKTFTGIAIMQLRDRGLLSLDDPLIKYIPELAAAYDPFGPISQVTIRHVMAHSGDFAMPPGLGAMMARHGNPSSLHSGRRSWP